MFYKDKTLEKIANDIIRKHDELRHLTDDALKIIYLRSDENIKNGRKTIFADTEKLNKKHRAMTGAHFVITFYADSEDLEGDQLEILMYHELRHVGWDGENAKIIPHDCEDFKSIVQKYGVDWAEKRH